jgi:hypothetical protein
MGPGLSLAIQIFETFNKEPDSSRLLAFVSAFLVELFLQQFAQ